MVITFTKYTGLPSRVARIIESLLLSVSMEKETKTKLLKQLYFIGLTAFWDSTTVIQHDLIK